VFSTLGYETYVEKPLQHRIVEVWAAKAEYHLCRERKGSTTYVVEQVVRRIQKTLQQELVLEILVWHIFRGDFDIENIVNQFMNQSPGLAIMLVISLLNISND
jgi:hypothetical protein